MLLSRIIQYLIRLRSKFTCTVDVRTKAHWDKSPLGQKPTGQKPTALFGRVDKSPLLKKMGLSLFKTVLTLIRLLLQGKLHMQCVFTDIIISPVCCDKQLNLGVKSHLYLKKINLHFGSNNLF